MYIRATTIHMSQEKHYGLCHPEHDRDEPVSKGGIVSRRNRERAMRARGILFICREQTMKRAVPSRSILMLMVDGLSLCAFLNGPMLTVPSVTLCLHGRLHPR